MQFFGHRNRVEPAGPAVVHDHADAAELQSAYERGRRDGRRRRRHPMIAIVVSAAALVGAVTLGLAAREGSFTAGGQVVDRQLSIAAGQAQLASRDAAVATGEAVRGAGTDLRQRTADRIG